MVDRIRCVVANVAASRKLICHAALLLLALSGTAHAISEVPEMDAGSAGSALALLVGTGILLKEQLLARINRK